MVIELASNNLTQINGVYNLAGNLATDTEINDLDLLAVANLAKETH